MQELIDLNMLNLAMHLLCTILLLSTLYIASDHFELYYNSRVPVVMYHEHAWILF